MCGFIGRIRRDPSDRCISLTAALPCLMRRGPDLWNYWQAADTSVELLHTRLAIVDPAERSRQPFTDPLSGLTVVFNGEIYNYGELRNELKEYSFRTSSDTEVLLVAFARWGIEGLKRLRGMFSSAIIGEKERRVYLIRDPIGKKPLYVARWQTSVVFGSSVLALAATHPGSLTIRWDLLEHYWQDSYIPPDQAIIKDCEPLSPGEVAIFDFSGKFVTRSSCIPAEQSPSVSAFEKYLPPLLRQHPSRWSSIAILKNFHAVWKLLVWSRFMHRISKVQQKFAKTMSASLIIPG